MQKVGKLSKRKAMPRYKISFIIEAESLDNELEAKAVFEEILTDMSQDEGLGCPDFEKFNNLKVKKL